MQCQHYVVRLRSRHFGRVKQSRRLWIVSHLEAECRAEDDGKHGVVLAEQGAVKRVVLE